VVGTAYTLPVRLAALLFVLTTAAPAWAQTNAVIDMKALTAGIAGGPVVLATAQQEPLNPSHPESPANPRRPAWAIFKDIGRDFTHLATPDTAMVLGIGGVAAAIAHPLDDTVNARLVGDPWVGEAFETGKILGYGLVQGGVAAATYAWGRAANKPKVVHVGVDLARAQILTAGLTYGLKAAVNRERPDGTSHSFPSGHASVTFATATVLQRHFGWKGAVAYSVSAYVAASRLHENRHHLSDVIFGAAIGTIAGRTVTRHGRDTWSVNAAPLRGGMYIGVSR
jgi:membrane-associated phospholipid phosphatase